MVCDTPELKTVNYPWIVLQNLFNSYTRMNTAHRQQIVRKEEAGFALPSILLLIIILLHPAKNIFTIQAQGRRLRSCSRKEW
jgi:hypothetical protein